jgi:hypothetical protein
MKRPDALSHHADHPRGEEDNTNITLLRPEHFQIQATGGVTLSSKEEGFLQRIRECKNLEEPVAKALRELQSGDIHAEEWELQEGLILY